MPTAFPIAAIFLFISALEGSFKSQRSFLSDKWNIAFSGVGALIILSTIFHTFDVIYNSDSNVNLISIWGGLFNWIPMFWLFWAFNIYLIDKCKRKIVAMVLIAGTIPVILSCLAQYIFNLTGPFETLFGLVIWYQKPILFDKGGGVTGLFSNANYAASWLNFVWPFAIAAFLEKSSLRIKSFNGFISLLISSLIFLTNSRLAWLGLIIAFTLMGGIKFFLVFIVIFFILFIFLNQSESMLFIAKKILPERFFMEFTTYGYKTIEEHIPFSRLNIWNTSLEIIYSNPFFGSGFASFPIIYETKTNYYVSHAHNFFLEIAMNYGILAGVSISVTILILLIKCFNFAFLDGIYNKNISTYDKAWIVSTLIFFFSQMFDIQYYDGKISILSWVLLSGTRCILLSKKNN